jgi:hypothetical protein
MSNKVIQTMAGHHEHGSCRRYDDKGQYTGSVPSPLAGACASTTTRAS